MKKLFLVDAYALIFKYYYAFLGRPMRNRAGMNTSVVFGFVKFLRDIQKRERPDLLGVAFDPKGGSFRREIFPEYKANRAETPEDILLSVPYVKRVLEAMCIPILEVEGYEADDVIGTLSQKGVEAGYEVFMVTPDKDYGQLVRDNCTSRRAPKGASRSSTGRRSAGNTASTTPASCATSSHCGAMLRTISRVCRESARRAPANSCRSGERWKISSTTSRRSRASRARRSPNGATNCALPRH